MKLALAGCILMAACAVSFGGPITLTFEGVGDNTAVGNFYAAQGITFSNAFGSVDSDGGGTGNFGNEPSNNTVIMNFNGTSSTNIVMNVPGGFTGSVSFYHNNDTVGTVTVFAGLNGTGGSLGSVGLSNNRGGCGAAGDPNPPAAPGNSTCWTQLTINFAGTGQSVTFSNNLAFRMFDDISLNTVAAGPSVPEPGTMGLMIGGALTLAAFARYRRR